MVFGKGKPLGSRGLYWLKLHLASMAGEKGTQDQLVEFTERNMANVLDSADFPLAGQWCLSR